MLTMFCRWGFPRCQPPLWRKQLAVASGPHSINLVINRTVTIQLTIMHVIAAAKLVTINVSAHIRTLRVIGVNMLDILQLHVILNLRPTVAPQIIRVSRIREGLQWRNPKENRSVNLSETLRKIQTRRKTQRVKMEDEGLMVILCSLSIPFWKKTALISLSRLRQWKWCQTQAH